MITIKSTRSLAARTAVVARLVPSDALDRSGVEAKLLARLGFTGEDGSSVTVTGDAPAITLLVGVGASDLINAESVRRGAALAVRALARHPKVVLDLGPVEDGAIEPSVAAGAAAEGAALGGYRFDTYRAPSKDPQIDTVTLVTRGARAALDRAAVVAGAVTFARDLVNEPGGTLTPSEFAARVAARAKASGATAKVMNLAQIRAAKLGGVLAVNQGSGEEPRFVTLTHAPKGATRSIALVGKGITFDSGGLSIKPADAMMTMKCDMAGAAAVAATVCALAELGAPVKVTGYLPMTDNMTGGDAQRPGDVYTARNGTTVEVLNTDAEGRLVLADAISLACEAKPDVVVDLATLTGACMVALGDKIAGLLGNDDALADELLGAADRTGERLWRLPLPADYRKLLDSPIADVKNIGSRYGGTLTAGLFLQEFVTEGTAWAHLDIAGAAWSEEVDAEIPKGGTGFGVRTLIDWLS